MLWKSFTRGYGSLGGRQGRAAVLGHLRYVHREQECSMSETISFGEVIDDPARIRARWREIYDIETGKIPLEGTGNETPAQRKIGPKRRWDARVMERLAVPLPNGVFDTLDEEGQRRKIRQLVHRLGLHSSDITWALHAGHRQGREDNLHLHILYRPRGIDGRKPHMNRRELRALRTRQLQAITDWVIQQGLEALVPGPSNAVHLGPCKSALAARGMPLYNMDEQLMAHVLDLANATRQAAAEAARKAWNEAEQGAGEASLRDAGWQLVQEGGRGTWTLVLQALPRIHFAVRRLLDAREQDVAARVQAMQGRAVEATGTDPDNPHAQMIELARHPRTGEVAVWKATTGTVLVLDDQGAVVRRVYIRRIRAGDIDWTAVGRMAIGRIRLGDGDTCGAVALGHDPARLALYVEGLTPGRREPQPGAWLSIL